MHVLLIVAAAPGAQAAVQIAPDGVHRLISKDVGAERWAITVHPTDGTVIGNVHRRDGGAPQFLSCRVVGRAEGQVQLRCRGTHGCESWQDLGEVSVPASFFEPPAECSAEDVRAVPAPRVAGAGPQGRSALRVTPDARTVLISKDLDGERWTIARQLRDHSVSGNVFSADGPAKFLWCDDSSAGSREARLECVVAEACACAPCGGDAWSALDPVTVPTEFLEDRRCSGDASLPDPPATRLVPASGDAPAGFGYAIDSTDELAVVTAYGGGTGGSAHVFARAGGAWRERATLTAPGLELGTVFGIDVTAARDAIAVQSTSFVHVFARSSSRWREAARFSFPAVGGELPEITSLGMSDDLLVATAGSDDKNAAHVFARSGSTWRQVTELVEPPDPSNGHTLGGDIAISGETIAIVWGGGGSLAHVLIYERQGEAWEISADLSGEGKMAGFGRSLALDGHTLLVGADYARAHYGTRVPGEVYVFEKQGGVWRETATLTACGPDLGRFGSKVALSGDIAVVGTDDYLDGGASGDLHVFERISGGWSEKGRLTPSDAPPNDRGGGRYVSITGNTVLAGAAADRAVYAFDLDAALLAPHACPAPDPRPLAWPVPDWRVEAPEEHGMSASLLEQAREYVFQEGMNTHGVVIARHGAIVAEWYEPGRDASSFAASWSVAKSFAGALVGVALDEGLIPSLDEPLTTYYPEWLGTDKQGITLRHVLSMASGLGWDEYYGEGSDIAYMASVASDHLAVVLGQPLLYEPGSVFQYSSGDSMLLSGILETATGVSAAEYAQEKLFGPLGMAPVEWWRDLAGRTLTYCCIDTPTRELAKFGLLYARGGRWQDEQIVPAEWVARSALPAVSTDYGFQWRLAVSGGLAAQAVVYAAVGYDGQFIYVVPDLDLVVVRNGHYVKDPGPPIADPTLFARYPAQGLGGDRGTIGPATWEHELFLRPVLESVFE